MKKPTLIFIDSMSDIFLNRVRRDFLDLIFDQMERARWHTYQILTKRSALMLKYVNDRYRRCAPRHMWFGVSVEKPEYGFRIQHLRETNCAVRFLSCEPVLEPLPNLNLDRIDQVIVGGECARKPRPMKAEWALDIRDQCLRAGVSFFFKQWGGRSHGGRPLGGREWLEHPPIIMKAA